MDLIYNQIINIISLIIVCVIEYHLMYKAIDDWVDDNYEIVKGCKNEKFTKNS